mmetsp:Transcript_26941/g.42688  ORF Transcript_26941/g.42688 Transcript_26941/m.42688 type:complete len:84 (+) Transcript_26941:130-381(+)
MELEGPHPLCPPGPRATAAPAGADGPPPTGAPFWCVPLGTTAAGDLPLPMRGLPRLMIAVGTGCGPSHTADVVWVMNAGGTSS